VDIIKRAREIIEIERDALSNLAVSIGEPFEEAVNLIINAKGRVVITGMGKSGMIGKKISATLSSVGTPSFFMHPAEAIHGDIGMLANGDIIIGISNSGESDEVVKLIPVIKRFGLKLIAMAGRADSTLAKYSDVFLDVSVKEEACRWDIVPTSSTTTTLAMGDALSLVVMEKKSFKREDFAINHPGGSIGRGLLVKVSDLMIKGSALPIVADSTSFVDVIKEMSDKKLGMTTVVDNDGKLLGIVTDGDLRRLLEAGGDNSDKRAVDIMSKNPTMVEEDEQGGTALKIMEDNKITALVVVEEGKPKGVIHLHDLLRAGVA